MKMKMRKMNPLQARLRWQARLRGGSSGGKLGDCSDGAIYTVFGLECFGSVELKNKRFCERMIHRKTPETHFQTVQQLHRLVQPIRVAERVRGLQKKWSKYGFTVQLLSPADPKLQQIASLWPFQQSRAVTLFWLEIRLCWNFGIYGCFV